MSGPTPGMSMHPGDLSAKALDAAKAVPRLRVAPGHSYAETLVSVHIKLIWDVLDLVLTPEQRAVVVASLEHVERGGK